VPNPSDRLINLLTLAKAAVYRDDRVAVYALAMQLCGAQRGVLGATIPPGLRQGRKKGEMLDHNNLTWFWYTSNYYWAAANYFKMGFRDQRWGKMGVWLTRDMARKAALYTKAGKRAGREPRTKEWVDWWQSYKAVHRDVMVTLDTIAVVAPATYRTAARWGDIWLLLNRCRMAAERGALWPKEVERIAREEETAERRAPSAVPVAKMIKKGHPNRVCADGTERWRFSQSYRRCGETLGLGELDANGKHIWLAEGTEHTAVATACKARNIGLSIVLS
jgi:hypothetical protein